MTFDVERKDDDDNILNLAKNLQMSKEEGVTKKMEDTNYSKYPSTILVDVKTTSSSSNSRAYITVAILCLVNLLNYMDRYTVAAVLIPIQKYFVIDDTEGGLLQTVFICAYMIFAPICGYLGDRYSRKWIMIVGIFIWSTTVLLSSFVKSNHFWMFFVCRGIVGIGEASYSTVSPTIIADLFSKDKRSRMLMLFYFAIPVGSGLGYIIGSGVAELLDSWQWGVRVTPILGVVCLFLLVFVLKEPERGVADAAHHLQRSSWISDLVYLAKNKTFIWSTLGFVCVAFVSGAVSLWAPSFVIYSQAMQLKPFDMVSLIFGFVTCLSGFAGVTLGSVTATRWRRTNPRADPLVCGFGMLLCLPFYFVAINIVAINLPIAWLAMFIMVIYLCLNWAIVTDLLMYVVIPSRRSTANAVQILFGHLLGDASSPYIIGAVSDALRKGNNADFEHFLSLKYALFIPSFILILGGFFFLGAAWFIEHDKKLAELLIKNAITGDVSIVSTREPPPVSMALCVLPTVDSSVPNSESSACLLSPGVPIINNNYLPNVDGDLNVRIRF